MARDGREYSAYRRSAWSVTSAWWATTFPAKVTDSRALSADRRWAVISIGCRPGSSGRDPACSPAAPARTARDRRRRRNTAPPANPRRNVPERPRFSLTFSPSRSRSRHGSGDDPAPRGFERHGSRAPAPPQFASRNRNAGGREAGLLGGDLLRAKRSEE